MTHILPFKPSRVDGASKTMCAARSPASQIMPMTIDRGELELSLLHRFLIVARPRSMGRTAAAGCHGSAEHEKKSSAAGQNHGPEAFPAKLERTETCPRWFLRREGPFTAGISLLRIFY